MVRTRTWFMIPFVIGGIFETVGYVGRAMNASQAPEPYLLGPYIVQSLLLLLGPALFAASIYMELGRIVLMVKREKALPIRRKWLTLIFVIGDVFSFSVQAAGGGLMSSGEFELLNPGENIIVGGLLFQIVWFGLFVTAAVIFHVRLSKSPTQLLYERPWTKHMISLYIVSVLIFVRSVVRCIGDVQGNAGYIMSHEAFLYVFDGALMFLAVITMNVIHPGEVAKHVRELRSYSKELEDSARTDNAYH
ncbi:hypothetical protein LTR37_013166 [Vermiconidia calcicola]|uniref:Uncharacterized protein n=1 Tax=Vermiconidia calcicola TaxID=1690605 RepID=A0ACC3MYN0_9PEZI|nr:hypothetical protein LTR37_013166 [Vermiconidia calcicola]